MRTHEGLNPLSRAVLVHAGLLTIATTAVFLVPRSTFPLYRLDVPCTVIVGTMATALLYPIFACLCSHTIHHYVLLLDAGLKERFDRAARDSACLFDERRSAARRELRQISVDTVRAAKQVSELRNRLMFLGWTGLVFTTVGLGLQSYVMSGLPTLASVMAGLMLFEVAGLLLQCRSRIGRDFPHPGPTTDDFDRLDKDVEVFEQIYKELLLGQRCARAVA